MGRNDLHLVTVLNYSMKVRTSFNVLTKTSMNSSKTCWYSSSVAGPSSGSARDETFRRAPGRRAVYSVGTGCGCAGASNELIARVKALASKPNAVGRRAVTSSCT